jgi:hypothetical protein
MKRVLGRRVVTMAGTGKATVHDMIIEEGCETDHFPPSRLFCPNLDNVTHATLLQNALLPTFPH